MNFYAELKHSKGEPMSRELRRRVEVLHLLRLNATPLPPIPVIIAGEGERPDQARQRAGVALGAFCVIVETTDASTPRLI